jgi:hypothetical protein
MAQAVSRWPLTAETWIRASVSSRRICGGQIGTGTDFSTSSSISTVCIIPPLLYTHLPLPHEVCDSSDQAAHYHALGPKLGASFLTQYLAGTEERSTLFFIVK